MITRRQIIRGCKSRGYVMEPSVLEAIQQHLQQQPPQNEKRAFQELLGGFHDHMEDSNNNKNKMITLGLWESFMIGNSTDITAPPAQAAVNKNHNNNNNNIRRGGEKSGGGGTNNQESVGNHCDSSSTTIVNAFDTPRLVYNTLRKQFRVEEKRWSLFGSAQDKIIMSSQRYALIHQRILRHDLLKPEHHTKSYAADLFLSQSQLSSRATSTAGRRSNNSGNVITPIETLLGKEHTNRISFLILGILVQIDEGQYYLEDPTGQLPISFHDYNYNAGEKEEDAFFVLEQSILLVEATFQDGILYIQRMAQPFIEPRVVTQPLLQKQTRHEYYNVRHRNHHRNNRRSIVGNNQYPNNHNHEKPSEPFVILSDIHLDEPKTFLMLEVLFQSYEVCATTTPLQFPTFIFMGNFLSSSSFMTGITKTQLLQQCLDDLSTLLQQKFPKLSQHARMVLVPGPNDHETLIYPQQPLVVNKSKQQQYKQRHPNLEFATNPCRVRYHCPTSNTNKEMVVFRSDVLNYMQTHQLRFHSNYDHLYHDEDNETMETDDEYSNDENKNNSNNRVLHCKWIKTILDQGHLCPMSNTIPIYWNYDHAMRLYPLPDTLVLGGSSNLIPHEFHEIYYTVDIVYPGSWSKSSTYATYQYSSDEEMMDADSDYDCEDEVSKSQVEFHHVVQNK